MSFAVFDIGFGDAGKGLVTDYLCDKFPPSLNVRFSGGHQVSHSVVKNGVKHVFRHFGSGTLSKIPTYWSKFCTVHPTMLLNELGELIQMGLKPMIYIDPDSPITTPFEINHNKTTARFMKDGTCGMGFGSTIAREESFYHLSFLDLFTDSIFKAKIKAIEEWYGFSIDKEEMNGFLEDCKILTKLPSNIVCKRLDLTKREPVFEGSQGLLLDQHHGFFPNVTRSNTGTKNLSEIGVTDYTPILVTRAYQCRHGNGFMTNEDKTHNIRVDPNESNVYNQFQGKFRIALLDLDLLNYAIDKDPVLSDRRKVSGLAVTCLDHVVNDYRFTLKGRIYVCADRDEFLSEITNFLGVPLFGWSDSPETEKLHRA